MKKFNLKSESAGTPTPKGSDFFYLIMAENKKSFVLYADLIKSIEHLTYEEKGILLTHLLEYVNDMNPILTDRLILTAWNPIELQLKRDLKKYEEVKAKRSIAGKRSAELRALKNDEQNSTNSTSVESVQQCSTNSTVNDNDNDNVNENVNDNVILLEKETKEENLPKENQTEIFPESESVETGAEERKKVAPKKERSEEKPIMPDEFIEIWEEWKEYRKAKRLKSYAGLKWEQMAVDKLLELSDKNPTIAKLILKQTYENSYQGFFPLKQNTNGITNTTNTGFSTSKPSTNNGNSGKRTYRQILAERLTNELKANGEGSNITIDAEICE